MRIAHLIETLDPAGGGPPAVAVQLSAAQAGLGHEVALISYAGGQRQQQIDAFVRSTPGADQVRLVFLPRPASRIGRILTSKARRQLQRLVPGWNMIHIHGTWSPLYLTVAAIAHAHGVPYTITPHGMLDPWSLAQKRLKKSLAMAMGYRRMFDRAAFMHMVSDTELELIAPLKLRSPNRVIPNGVSLQDIEPLPEPGRFLRSCEVLQGRPFILFLSRLHPEKGLNLLLEAFAAIANLHPSVQLVVAGPDAGAAEPLRLQAQQLGLTERVHLIGPIYGREKYEPMVDALCFCMPSRHEAFSMAITEALACGAPVVISHECRFPQVAQVEAGIVVSLHADEVAQALDRLIHNEPLRRRMGAAGKKLIRDHYTWPRIAQQTILGDHYTWPRIAQQTILAYQSVQPRPASADESAAAPSASD